MADVKISKIAHMAGNWSSSCSLHRETATHRSTLPAAAMSRAELKFAFKIFTGLLGQHSIRLNMVHFSMVLQGFSRHKERGLAF